MELAFSILIATYNRPQHLSGLLESLAALNYSRERFEVIVVDDGSPAPLDPVVAPFQARITVRCLRQSRGGVASARQKSVEAAAGEYVAFTDDDCRPSPDWLQALEAALTAAPGCAVGGQTVNALTGNPYSTATGLLETYLRDHWNRGPAAMGFFPTSNLAMPTDRLRSIGSFDVRSWPHGGEDRDLCARWTEHGYSLHYAPEAVVHHFHDLSFFTFLRQHLGYGRGAFRFRQARSQRSKRTIRVESPSFYLRLPLFGLRQKRGVQGLFIAALLAAAQMSNAAGFLWEWAVQRSSRT
jgi:glycosyltransferase involved in cell wall biosynthesis